MSILDQINNELTPDIETFVLSLYFESRVKQNISEQVYQEPVGLTSITRLIQARTDDFYKAIREFDYTLSLDMENLTDPLKLLALYLDKKNE